MALICIKTEAKNIRAMSLKQKSVAIYIKTKVYHMSISFA